MLAVILGAIEIGLHSTRLAVSDVRSRSSRVLIDRDHRLTAGLGSLDRLGVLLMTEAETAREAGAGRIEAVAAPELHGSRLIRLAGRFAEAAGIGSIRTPTRKDRVAATFVGATRGEPDDSHTRLAVARIDEDLIGVAAGWAGHRPDWIGSRPVGATAMSRKARFFDPPLPAQIEAAISGATRAIASLHPPSAERFLVSSRLAPVVVRLCGERPGAREARKGLNAILGQTADDISAWFGIGPGPSRQLPGLLVGHVALAGALGREVEPVTCDPVAARHWLVEESRQAGGVR